MNMEALIALSVLALILGLAFGALLIWLFWDLPGPPDGWF